MITSGQLLFAFQVLAKRHNMSLHAMCISAGISSTTINKTKLSGSRSVTVHTICKIADSLGITLTEFFYIVEGDNAKNINQGADDNQTQSSHFSPESPFYQAYRVGLSDGAELAKSMMNIRWVR